MPYTGDKTDVAALIRFAQDLEAENAGLRVEVALWKDEVAIWKDRWEAEHADHQRTIEHCDKQLKEADEGWAGESYG